MHISNLAICILTHFAQEIFTGLSVAHRDNEHDFEDLLNLDLCNTCMDVKIKKTTVTPDLILVVVAHSNTASKYVKSPNKEVERSSQRLKLKIKFFIYKHR